MRYRYYKNNVLLLFAAEIRYQLDQHPKSNLSIPDYISANSWCDWDIKQIYTITKHIESSSKLKRIAKKHYPAYLGVDQPYDKSDIFKLIKFM